MFPPRLGCTCRRDERGDNSVKKWVNDDARKQESERKRKRAICTVTVHVKFYERILMLFLCVSAGRRKRKGALEPLRVGEERGFVPLQYSLNLEAGINCHKMEEKIHIYCFFSVI